MINQLHKYILQAVFPFYILSSALCNQPAFLDNRNLVAQLLRRIQYMCGEENRTALPAHLRHDRF
ncbi:hypothetical protein D3C81_2152550 [compost metagenome]